MQPLTGLDAAFIYLETPHSPMHIGGVYLIDAADAPDDFGYERFKQHLAERLRLAPVFRQRLVEVPMHLSHPVWINDPEFDLDFHVPRWALPEPGGLQELTDLANQSFSRMLNRGRPLWEMAFVEGLDSIEGLAPGSFALISRIHHAAVDGMSGAEILGAIFDVDDQPRKLPPDRWQPESEPSAASLLLHSYARLGSKVGQVGKVAGQLVAGLGRAYGLQRIRRLPPPSLPLSAPQSLFNAPVSPHRTFWAADLELERIKSVKNRFGVTVNDVVLAVCASGLRHYLLERKALPEKPLVAMAPISVRSAAQRRSGGNQVSAMLVNLETTQADPVQRLLAINRHTTGSKIYSGAMPVHQISDLVSSELAALAARLYSRTAVGDGRRPFFNLVITNVPGPPVPLYVAGAKIRRSYGTAPILDGMGLLITAFSYAGRLTLSLTSCREILPDPQRLAALIEQALADLETAPEPREPAGSVTEELRQTLDHLDEVLAGTSGDKS